MRSSWDSLKSDGNYRDRGFDFEFASLIFQGPTLEQEDARQDYGERRIIAIGRADALYQTIVYTDRTDPYGRQERRIISARRSNRHERQAYQKSLKEG